ncbi:hypothetical protein MUP77_19630 [Candidatus Bathyarchaeota archaeon]|nr:hypothetical protein [Candidatus Bathyarchaeota archaeon]
MSETLPDPYRDYHKYGSQIRSRATEYRKSSAFSAGLKGLLSRSLHRNLFWSPRQLAPRSDDLSALAVGKGWRLGNPRNKMLVFRVSGFGNVKWWRTGKVLPHVYKPVNQGRLNWLLCRAFYETELVPDWSVFEDWMRSFEPFGGHLVNRTGQRLPYVRIDDLKESHGIVVVLGDSSHPDAVEIQFCFPRWAERLEQQNQVQGRVLEVASKVIEGNSRIIEGNGKIIENGSRVIELNTRQSEAFTKNTEQFVELMRDLSTPKSLDRKRQGYIS